MNGDQWLQLNAFLPRSRANGPGVRAVVWVQGCSLGCPGCFNPESHAFNVGERVSVTDLVRRIQGLEGSIEGVTISGGEPFQQRAAVTSLLHRIKAETKLSVIVFTGFTWSEIQAMRDREILAYVDVLIAGRYDETQRLARGLRGSANKTLHFLTERYTIEDINATPAAEVIITPDGAVIVSGIRPPSVGL